MINHKQTLEPHFQSVDAIRMFMQEERAYAQSVIRRAGKECLYRVALSQLAYYELGKRIANHLGTI